MLQPRTAAPSPLAPPPAPAVPPVVKLTMLVTDNPDALTRIVRVASASPYTLLRLRVGTPREGRRHLAMTVGGDPAGFETLRKRLTRVVDVMKVTVAA